MLKVEGVKKTFGGVTALENVSLGVEKSQIYGVIGPNGAGKSTLFRIISGTLKADEGKVVLNDREITGLAPHQTSRLRIGYVFQESFLFATMTLAENMLVSGATEINHGLLSLLPFYQSRKMKDLDKRTASVMKKFNLSAKADLYPAQLSYGDRRRALIAHVLINEASLLLLDEPSAGMNQAERRELTDDILRIRDEGHTIMIIEHNLRLIMGICDCISVLNFGKVLCEGTPAKVSCDQAVIEAYIGRRHE
jgi:branched-chain amino acid transport system ATP-binding protein